MTLKIGWSHPIDEADQWDGFNEPGIEHFAGSPVRHLAREVNQNSFDSGAGGVVRVKMNLLTVETSSIPNVDELKNTFKLCKEASHKESTKAEQFFATALSELAKKKISVLEISDFNTFGMRGPSSNGTPFYAFMKAKGQSKKDSATATGSFGIGKFAPYAVSKLRTVFVSSVFKNEDGSFEQLTQGKSILMSHDKGSKRLQGTGFWGVVNRCQPVAGISNGVPEWAQRVTKQGALKKSAGTKLTILGFDNSLGWRENLAVSVAENFFGSIVGGKLVVEIDDKYLLNADTIVGFFSNDEIQSAIAKQKNEPEQFINCRHYLSTMVPNSEVIVEESEVQNLGLCQLRLLLSEGLPKRVCILRNGMFISDAISLPGLKSFSDFKEFVAVVECKNKKGSELLRAMEPPRHDDFEPDRLPTKDEQRKGEVALKHLATWVREMLKRHAKTPVSEVTTLDELKEYFADENGDSNGKGNEESNPVGKITIRARPLSQKSELRTFTNVPKAVVGDNEEEGGVDGNSGVGGNSGGTAIKTPVVGAAVNNPGKSLVGISNVRAVVVGPNVRRVSFTPSMNGNLSLSVLEAGADSDYDLAVISSSAGEVAGGRVMLKVASKERLTLDVTLSENFSGALKVVAHEI